MTSDARHATPREHCHGTPGGTLSSALEALDGAANYRAWIISLAVPHLRAPLLEVGAGHGTFTGELAALGAVHAVEPDDDAFELLRSRYTRDPRITVLHGTIDDVDPAASYGSVVMINVLEHVADDLAALRSLRDRMEPGAHIVVWVPAFELLFSEFDRELGHHRRYRRPQLEQLVADAGLRVDECRYVNLPGWFGWLLVARMLRQRPTAGPLVAVFDRYVVPAVRAVERRFRPPFGQSILLVAHRPSGGA